MKTKIKMKAVDSSNIAAVGYDETTKILQIKFTSGSSYIYKPVPKLMAKTFMDSPINGSYGQHFSAYIKNAPGIASTRL